jgi:hypothetical protein
MQERLTEKSKLGGYQPKCHNGVYQQYIDKLGKIEDLMEKYQIKDIEMLEKMIVRHDKYCNLEDEIGCPLDVRCKVVCGTTIYGIDGREYNVDYIEKDGFYCTRYFKWKDYGTKWFLENPKVVKEIMEDE